MTAAHPAAWLLLAGFACVAAILRRSSGGWRLYDVWRMLTLACVTAALSGVSFATRKPPLTIVAVLDRSASLLPGAQRRALSRLDAVARTMETGDRLGLVVFGADAAGANQPIQRSRASEWRAGHRSLPAVEDTGTNIEAAIRLALASLSRVNGARQILLLSDGHETVGRAERAASDAMDAGVRIDVIAPESEALRGNPELTRAVAPDAVRVREPFVVSAELEGTPRSAVYVRTYRDGETLGGREVEIADDGHATVAFSDSLSTPGAHSYRIALAAESTADENPAADVGAVVVASGVPRVLYVALKNGILRQVLADAGFDVDFVRPELAPVAAGDLLPYDAVVIDDVAADAFRPAALDAIARHVERAGGGLVLLGGPETLRLTGFAISPLGPILPIDLRPRAGRRAAALGLVVVFDKSGSMADLADGMQKIDVARQAVMRVLDVMAPADSLGVIAFDSQPTEVVALAPVPPAATVLDRLARVRPGGATLIAPPTALALQWLNRGSGASVDRRQILLLSDGRTSAEDAASLRTLVRKGGVRLSAVSIGSNADRALLKDLAEATGGRAVFAEDAASVPLVVAREAARSASGAVVEERFRVRANEHPALAAIDRGALPILDGYVVSSTKPSAAALLTSHLGDPVLAAWRVGMGRVTAFTAGLDTPWSRSFRAWNDCARMWMQTMRWTARSGDASGVRAAFVEDETGTRLIVDAEREDGHFVALRDVRATVRLPAGDLRDVLMSQSEPGRWEGPVNTSARGPYVVSFAGVAPDGTERRLVRGTYFAGRERPSATPDLTLLTHVADATGGRVLSPGESPFSRSRPRGYVEVSEWLMIAALAMFVLELAVGRGAEFRKIRLWFRSELLRARRVAIARTEESGP